MVGFPTSEGVGPAIAAEGNGPAVLLISGMLSGPAPWAAVASTLRERFRVITCDLTGYLPPGRRKAVDHAQCWRDAMDYLEEPSAHLIAHGSGCLVAASLALDSPYRALSLTVIDPIIRRTESSPSLQSTWHLQTLTQWLETGHGPVVRRPEHQRALEQVLDQQTTARLPQPAATAVAALNTQDILVGDMSGLTDLDFPVLALAGDGESDEVRELIRAVYARAPHFLFQQVPGVRHNCLREAPGALAGILNDHLCNVMNPVTT